jgi:formate hydrogenlyase subunit 3/multisubunit Na+/H+ antiporter MnhD subunit
LAISGIPPFNGFISEFLIYSGILHHLPVADFSMSLVGIGTLLGLVLIGGLCIYCFTKAFGMSFLGSRRSEIIHHTEEVPKIMLLPAILLIGLILCIGLMAPFFGGAMVDILRQLIGINPSAVLLEEVTHALRMTSNINIVLIVVVAATLARSRMAPVTSQGCHGSHVGLWIFSRGFSTSIYAYVIC